MAKKPVLKPVFDYKECMACNDCIALCPLSCLIADKVDIDSYKKAYPQLGTYAECNGCKICANDCPVGAIAMV